MDLYNPLLRCFHQQKKRIKHSKISFNEPHVRTILNDNNCFNLQPKINYVQFLEHIRKRLF